MPNHVPSPTDDAVALDLAKKHLADAYQTLTGQHPSRTSPLNPDFAEPVAVMIALVQQEVERARRLHPKPFASFHEGLCILEEEFEELKAEVFKKQRDFQGLRTEAMQLGAMCVRFLLDLT